MSSARGRVFPPQLALACGFAFAAVSEARADRTVVVSSVVDQNYATRRATEPGRVETYVFARGQYFNAIPMDRYLKRMDFHTIAKTLAVDLKKQRYEPAASMLTTDLVLVVHWGVTQPNEPAASAGLHDYDLLREASNAVNEARGRTENADLRTEAGLLEAERATYAFLETQADFRRESGATLSAHARDEPRRQTNIELLGLQTSLYQADQAVFGSSLGETLRDMMNEERYFVIVMAYDGPAMREGRKKRLWTTRASIRGPGVNFAIALDLLSGTAADFHGKPVSGLAFEGSRERKHKEGEVHIGELKVLGDTTAPTVPPAKR